MPIICTQGGDINNSATCNATQKSDAILAITGVKLANVWRAGVKISNSPHIRVDCQGVDAHGQANLQAQINGKSGSSTVAHVLVDATVGKVGGPRKDAQIVYAERQIRGALGNSLETGKSYTVSGTPT